jgi:hypothetical protein
VSAVPCGAQIAHEIDPARLAPPEPDVDERKLGILPRERNRLSRVRGAINVESAVPLEPKTDRSQDTRFVIDDEDSNAGRSLRGGGSGSDRLRRTICIPLFWKE